MNFPENRDHLEEDTKKENKTGLASAWEEGRTKKGDGRADDSNSWSKVH